MTLVRETLHLSPKFSRWGDIIDLAERKKEFEEERSGSCWESKIITSQLANYHDLGRRG